MSVDVGKDYGIQISQKMQKRKVLEKLVLLQTPYKVYSNIGLWEWS